MKSILFVTNKDNGGEIIKKSWDNYQVLIFTDKGNVVYTDIKYKRLDNALQCFNQQWNELNNINL